MQFGLPSNTVLDVSYVGNHGFNRLRAFQGGANGAVDLNAVDIGAAYLPQNQDPTLGTSSVPGAAGKRTSPRWVVARRTPSPSEIAVSTPPWVFGTRCDGLIADPLTLGVLARRRPADGSPMR